VPTLRSIKGGYRPNTRQQHHDNRETTMNAFIATYAPLAALLTPVLAIAALNLLLALGGERGTLLLPIPGPLGRRVRRLSAPSLPVTRSPLQAHAPANDPEFRRAA
jgi:hypothetical protein